MSIFLACLLLLVVGATVGWVMHERAYYCNRMHMHTSQDAVDACDARCTADHGSVYGPCPECMKMAQELCVEDCLCDTCAQRKARATEREWKRRYSLNVIDGGRS